VKWLDWVLSFFRTPKIEASITVVPPTLEKLGDALMGKPVDDRDLKAKRIEIIRNSCIEAMEKFPPKKDWRLGEWETVETYCNLGVQHVCKAVEYIGFKGMLANDMVRKMKSDPDWAPVQAIQAQILANDGQLVIAGQIDDPHGHVAVVLPCNDKMTTSQKWGGEKVPWLANVGQKNEIMGANWAFKYRPTYFALVPK
jgi:hypothetical protein